MEKQPKPSILTWGAVSLGKAPAYPPNLFDLLEKIHIANKHDKPFPASPLALQHPPEKVFGVGNIIFCSDVGQELYTGTRFARFTSGFGSKPGHLD